MYMCMTKQYYRVRSLLHDRQYISNMQSRVYMCVFVHVRVRVDFISCLCGCTAEEVPASKPYVPPGRREMLKDQRSQTEIPRPGQVLSRSSKAGASCAAAAGVCVGGWEGGGRGGGGGGGCFFPLLCQHTVLTLCQCVLLLW